MRRPFASLADIEALEARPYREVVPHQTTFDLLRASAARYGARPAITFLESGELDGRARTVTYQELLARVVQAANFFRAAGVGEEDAVVLLAPNMPEAHYALWGAQAAGRACPINPFLNAEHIEALVRASRAKLIVALGPGAELDVWTRAAAVGKATGVRVVPIEVGTAAGASFQALLEREKDVLGFDPPLGAARIAAYYHTGGTTGAPKLALHTHGNEVHTSWFAPCFYDFDERTVEVNGFPLFHVAGAFVYGLSCFSVGAQQLVPTLSGMRNAAFLRNYWRFCEKYRVSALAAVPTILAQLSALPRDGADISSVKVALTGGSPLPTELAQRFEEATGLPVRNILGMTESAGLLSIGPVRGPRVPGSTGLRLPYSEVKAVRWSGTHAELSRPCAPGETGVIVARGPHVGPGYSDPARNAGMFEDGWLISGDLGHVDAQGNIFVTGRAKDVIIRGAHNLDPGMIEEAFMSHPAVSMCAAVSEPDAHAGELPVVFLALRPGTSLDGETILEEVRPRIAERAAVPKRVTLLETIPVTAIGKVYKPALRARAAEVKISEMLSVFPGIVFSVVAEDRAGAIHLRISIKGFEEHQKPNIKTCLAPIALPYELIWE